MHATFAVRPNHRWWPLSMAVSVALPLGCARSPRAAGSASAGDTSVRAAARAVADTTSAAMAGRDSTLPPSAATAAARLAASPRHGEWAMIPVAGGDSVRAWVSYPERASRAPVVVVVHEIFGLSTWVRSVADQLARDGYIAVAPDLLTGARTPGGPDSVPLDSAIALIRRLDPGVVRRQLLAAARYGMALPAALPRYGIVGFCWGGGTVFDYAVGAPSLGAAVVFYGPTPPMTSLDSIRAPVLAFYAGDDARITATVPATDSAMRALGKTYVPVTYEGAGHGFLRAQEERGGANLRAAEQAWPRALAWFRQYLGA